MYVVGMLGWASPHFRKPHIGRRILYIMFLSSFGLSFEIGNRNSNARKSQHRRVFLMECGKNLVDIVLQKRSTSPPQSLPYSEQRRQLSGKMREKMKTTSIEDASFVEENVTKNVESHAAMNICATTVSIVMLILALPNKGRSTDLLRQKGLRKTYSFPNQKNDYRTEFGIKMCRITCSTQTEQKFLVQMLLESETFLEGIGCSFISFSIAQIKIAKYVTFLSISHQIRFCTTSDQPLLFLRFSKVGFCHKFRFFCYILLKYENLIHSGKFHGK
ncbi:hypothetical protein T03_16750 [Trichinella britovi]|uniref:Uncharacterized protein n=1 Tax=Trichinella britovi TaxID=45882 RepID=A0A0V1CF75_TRIBR|nr:hypothetical protein T03_16750 [Trichinella britovi]